MGRRVDFEARHGNVVFMSLESNAHMGDDWLDGVNKGCLCISQGVHLLRPLRSFRRQEEVGKAGGTIRHLGNTIRMASPSVYTEIVIVLEDKGGGQ